MTAEETARQELSADELQFAEAFGMSAVDYLASKRADPSREAAERIRVALKEGD